MSKNNATFVVEKEKAQEDSSPEALDKAFNPIV